MQQFNKNNLKNIYTKTDAKIVDKLNNVLKQYNSKDRETFYDLIIAFDKDYDNVEKIKHYSYLENIASKAYTDFDALETYHNAMLKVNQSDNYKSLYHLLEDNERVTEQLNDYMSENYIYSNSELYDMIDTDLRDKGLDSEYRYLIDEIENNHSEYSQINSYNNELISYENIEEVFAEFYEDTYDMIDDYYFDDLDVAEPEVDNDLEVEM